MKHYLLLLTTVFISQLGLAQVKIEQESNKEDNNLYALNGLETKPEYEGGINEFYKYISENFKVPSDKRFKGGKVILIFVIEKDGSLTDIKVLKDCGFGTGAEALRVMENCKNWIPGEQNGKKVRVHYALPLSVQSK